MTTKSSCEKRLFPFLFILLTKHLKEYCSLHPTLSPVDVCEWWEDARLGVGPHIDEVHGEAGGAVPSRPGTH